MAILDSLVDSGSAPSEAPGAQITPEPAPTQADPSAVVEQYPFLGALATGKVPGVVFPQGWKNPQTKVITPEIVQKLGLVFYKPTKDSAIQLGLFNPGKVDRKQVEKLDKEGKLSTAFPSINNFVPSVSDTPASGESAVPESSEASPSGPSSGPVPTMVGPGPNPAAQVAAAKARLNNLQAPVPSQRSLPGGGIILNSLLKRAV